MASLCSAVRRSPNTVSLERFHQEEIAPLQEPDVTNDRWLQGLIQVAPLIGLVGTAAGILAGFLDLAAAKGVVTLRELAGPVSSALMTTVHGALCAVFCILVRTAFSTTDLHQQTDRWICLAWKAVAPILHKKPPAPDKGKQGGADKPELKGPEAEGATDV